MDIDDIPDLSECTVEDSLAWLLWKLDIEGNKHDPYALPYANYVMTWNQALPLRAIVIAQSPYPNPIYSETSAAMSFSEDLCVRYMKRRTPPTVEVLANDLYINVGIERELTTASIRDGWSMVRNGVLLLNVSVFGKGEDGDSFVECIDQVSVVNRLLKETELMGERNVDLICYGQGLLMASEITKTFKSKVMKLTKYRSNHPAHLSYKFDDLNHVNCHLNSVPTSRALAKHIRNYVAVPYTMGRDSESELKLNRALDFVDSLAKESGSFSKAVQEVAEITYEMSQRDDVHTPEVGRHYDMLSQRLSTLAFRASTFSARYSTADPMIAGLRSPEALRAGPTLPTGSPSADALNSRSSTNTRASVQTGKPVPKKLVPDFYEPDEGESPTPSAPSPARSRSTSVDTGPSGRPPEAKEKRKIKIAKLKDGSRVRIMPDGSRERMVPDSAKADVSSSVLSPIPEHQSGGADTPTATQASGSRGVRDSGNGGSMIGHELDPGIKSQLQCIEGIFEYLAGEHKLSDEHREVLDIITNDISSSKVYNFVTDRLVIALLKDIEGNWDFDLAEMPYDDNRESYESYRACKSVFEDQ